MKILVMGSGLMGPGAAYAAMSGADVAQVTLCDISQEQLDAAMAKLRSLPGGDKLKVAQVNLRDRAAARTLAAEFDVLLACLPKTAIADGIHTALAAGKPLVDLSQPPDAETAGLQAEVEAAGMLAMPGCGVEPGLTEIMARYLAEKLDRVDELHIKCGGIPETPAPPLGYKIVFGGQLMPVRDWDGHGVVDGQLVTVPRYGGVEACNFPGVGECEAWNENFMPWLLDLECLRMLRTGSQKTVRWPGYAAKISVLKELGLLSSDPVNVSGVPVAPKSVVDAVLYPRVRLEEGEHDITVFRVEVLGVKDGRPRRYKIEMVDRMDDLGFTSMARTTAFTGAIIARMVGCGDIQATGWVTPEKAIAGRLFDRLLAELAAFNVRFEVTTELIQALN